MFRRMLRESEGTAMAGEELGVVVRPGSVLHVCGAAEGGSGSEGNGSQVGHREEMFSGGVSWERFYAKEPDGQVVRVCVCVCVCVRARARVCMRA